MRRYLVSLVLIYRPGLSVSSLLASEREETCSGNGCMVFANCCTIACFSDAWWIVCAPCPDQYQIDLRNDLIILIWVILHIISRFLFLWSAQEMIGLRSKQCYDSFPVGFKAGYWLDLASGSHPRSSSTSATSNSAYCCPVLVCDRFVWMNHQGCFQLALFCRVSHVTELGLSSRCWSGSSRWSSSHSYLEALLACSYTCCYSSMLLKTAQWQAYWSFVVDLRLHLSKCRISMSHLVHHQCQPVL